MTQSRSGSAVVLASAAGLVAGLALWIAGQPSPALRTERGSPSPATASPTSTTVDPFAALEAIGMVPATPTARGRVAPDTALVLEATLRAASATCEEPEDGRCHAGCFRFVAVALDPGPLDLIVRVSSPNDPSDVLAESLLPGPRVDAGFCYAFAPGEGGERPVRIEVRARSGAGEVAVAGWREREPEEPPTPRSCSARASSRRGTTASSCRPASAGCGRSRAWAGRRSNARAHERRRVAWQESSIPSNSVTLPPASRARTSRSPSPAAPPRSGRARGRPSTPPSSGSSGRRARRRGVDRPRCSP